MVDETMRIGIITYHRSHNYGALLQAMGLRQYLVDKGHEVYFVDYWPIYQERMYQAIRCYDSTRDNVISYLKGVGKDIFTYPLKHRRIQKFRAFIKAYVDPYCIPTTEKLDMMVFGSDQIWRKQERLGKRFDSIYWGGGQFISS